MTLQLEVGKYYRNRKGDKVGPLVFNGLITYCFECNSKSWTEDGREWQTCEGQYDLIEEWKDEESYQKAGEFESQGFTINHDPVNHPRHYTSHPSGIECIQITRHMGFNLGNAMKYIWRADLKNGLEDLEKAKWYIDDEIDKRKAQS